MGLARLVGDVAGTGSDTLRITEIGGIGFAKKFAPLATETDTIDPSSFLLAYSEVAVGMYGLGHSDTYAHQILGREPAALLDALVGKVPDSWEATLRDLVCTVGATISVAVGSASRPLEIDDVLDLRTVFQEEPDSLRYGAPRIVVAPQQITQLLDSARQDPAYQNSLADHSAVQSLQQAYMRSNFLGLGMDFVQTSDVKQAASAHQGFGYSYGAIGWARASTGGLQVSNPQDAIVVPFGGLVIERDPAAGRQAQRAYEARAWIGVALANGNPYIQRRLISEVV